MLFILSALTALADNALAFILNAFALVWFRLLEGADFGGDLADLLLADAADGNGVLFDASGDAGGSL